MVDFEGKDANMMQDAVEMIKKGDMNIDDLDDPELKFEALNASIDSSNVVSPIFFVPFGNDVTNVIQNATDPFNDAVFQDLSIYYNAYRDGTAVFNVILTVKNASVANAIANIMIILENGTYGFIKKFSKNDSDVESAFNTSLCEGFSPDSDNTLPNTLSIFIANTYRDIFNEVYVNGGITLEYLNQIIAESKAIISKNIATVLYDFCTFALLHSSMDLDEMFAYFSAEAGIDVDKLDKGVTDTSKYSLCLQECLNYATIDTKRVSEIFEAIIVGGIYNITNFALTAQKHDALHKFFKDEENACHKDEKYCGKCKLEKF